MPIPNNITMAQCVGREATLDRNISNGAGQCIAKGSKVKIRSYGRALDIETEPCSCCGQYCKINGVKKDCLTLVKIANSDKEGD